MTSSAEPDELLVTIKPIDLDDDVASTSIGVPMVNSFTVELTLYVLPNPVPLTAT